MDTTRRIHRMTLAAALCAIGIIIPMFSPVRIVIEPASFTLASHVPIFIAMFISPLTALSVAVITTLGFLLSGAYSLVIVARAATHVIFALLGALYLRSRPQTLESLPKAALFSLVISLIHAVSEVIVVTPFYAGYDLKEIFYTQGYMLSVLVLVGAGTVVHSIVDFFIALVVWRPLRRLKSLSAA